MQLRCYTANAINDTPQIEHPKYICNLQRSGASLCYNVNFWQFKTLDYICILHM